jgi:hypothetical protein
VSRWASDPRAQAVALRQLDGKIAAGRLTAARGKRRFMEGVCCVVVWRCGGVCA